MLGPVITSAVYPSPRRRSIGTTRPVSPGWRADSSTTSVRSAGAGRMPSISAASCALAAQKSNWASASSVSRRRVPFAATSADSSSRIRPSSSSTAAWASRQALPSSTITSGSTNSVCAAARRVVDDALDAAPRLGPDRDDVAAVAERDDRLLEGAAQLRAHQGVQAAAEPVVGDAHGAAQRAQPRRRGVQQLAQRDRSCAPACSAAPAADGAGGRGRAGAAGAPRRGIVASRAAASSVSAISRNCCGSSRPPRTARPTQGSMSCAAPMPTPGRSWSSARAWSVSSRPRATMTGSADGTSVSARRRDGSNDVFSARRARTAGNSSSAIDRASTSAPVPATARR